MMEISTLGTSREKGRAVRSAASRRFLSLFCDFHGGLFSLGAGGKDEKRDFAKERDSLVRQFGMLLDESAFGDALLFKMVSINAFSVWNCLSEESFVLVGNNDWGSGIVRTVAAISFAFEYGAQLSIHTEKSIHKVEDKIQQQQQEQGGGGGGSNTSSGIRLIGPLLMLCEFLSHMCKRNKEVANLRASLLSSDGDTVTAGQGIEDLVRKMFFQSERAFWSAISELSQVLKNSDCVSKLLTKKIKKEGDDADDNVSSQSIFDLPTEFKSLTRGFAPFSFFDCDQTKDNKDSSPLVSIVDLTKHNKSTSSSGNGTAVDTYLTFEEAVEALELYPASSSRLPSSSSQSSQRSSRRSSGNHHRDVLKSTGQTEVQTRLKLTRFARFIARHVDSGDIVDVKTVNGPTATLLPNDLMDIVGSDVSQEETAMDLDSQEGILVYKETGNGPALLVPGALIVSRNEKQVNNHKPLLSPSSSSPPKKFNSASALLNLSTLLNQNMSNDSNSTMTTIPKNKSAPTFANIASNNDGGNNNFSTTMKSHQDLTSVPLPPPMPQSSSPPQAAASKLAGGGGSVLRPPPGFNNTDKPVNGNVHNVHHPQNIHLLHPGMQEHQPTTHQQLTHHLTGGGESLYNRNSIMDAVTTSTHGITPFPHHPFQQLSGGRHDAFPFPQPPGTTNAGSSVQHLSQHQPPSQTSNPFAYPMPPLGNGNNRFQELNLPAPTPLRQPPHSSSSSLLNRLTTSTPPALMVGATGGIPAYLGSGMNPNENHNANGTTNTTTVTMTPADLNMDLGNDLFGLRSLGLYDDNLGNGTSANASSYFVGSDASAQTKNPYI